MKTRDGVTLVSDHYLAPGGRPAPTLLMRQPYGRDIASTVVYAHPAWFARHGYNVVIQDVRGRGESEGDFYPFRTEGEDGYDTVQWVAGLPECDGNVGMYGFSYQGLTQLLAAAEQPPALRAIAPAMTAGDLYSGWFYKGGLLCQSSTVIWGTQMLRGDALRLGLNETSAKMNAAWSQLGAVAARAPYGQQDHLADPRLPAYFRDWISHDTPGEYWARHDISTRYDRIKVPALHLAGWYDLYAQGSIDCFESLQLQAGTSEARANQYLIAGPWLHIPWDRQIGEMDFGLDSVLPTDELLLRWFGHWLKGEDSWQSQPRARVFNLGRHDWATLSQWPPPAKAATYHLRSQGRANSSHGDGSLGLDLPAEDEPRDILVVDPDVPVAAPGPGAASGCFRQNRISAGNNVLVYRTGPLVEPIHIAGRPSVTLWLVSSREACDVVVKLTRTDRNNSTWNVSLGAARSQSLFGGEALPVDEVVEWKIALDSTSCVIDSGECLGLEIAGHAFPLFDRSANRLDVPAREAGPNNWRRVTVQIAHDREHPSALHVPLLN
jgi:putative CocE/NonD family hydrolase